jgi:hypothetical protein
MKVGLVHLSVKIPPLQTKPPYPATHANRLAHEKWVASRTTSHVTISLISIGLAFRWFHSFAQQGRHLVPFSLIVGMPSNKNRTTYR